MAETEELHLGTDSAVRAVQNLRAEIARLKQELQEVAQQLGSNPSTKLGAQFFGTAQQLSAAEGALSAVKGSASVGGNTSGNAAIQGAIAGASSFNSNYRFRSVADPQGIMNTIQGAGVSQSGMSAASLYLANGQIPVAPGQAFNPQQFVQNIIAQSATPLATQNASGSASNIFQGQYQYQQGIQSARFMRNSTIATTIGAFAYGGAMQYASNIASGELDPMATAQLYGRGSGGVLGAITGSAIAGSTNPLNAGIGAVIGAGVGAEAGGAAAALAMAPYMRTRNAALAIASFSARSGVSPYEYIGGGTAGRSLEELSADVSFRGKSYKDIGLIKSGLYTGTDIIGVPQLAAASQTLGSAYLASGRNPRGLVTEQAAQFARKYGMATPQMMQMAASGVSLESRFGYNQADILQSVGPENYGAYADLAGRSDLTPRQLTAYGNIQRQESLAAAGALRPRGSGAAQVAAYSAQMGEIGKLPDGTNSLAYAESYARMRSARSQSFAQTDAMNFGIPSSDLDAQSQILNSLPFSPGNRMAVGLRRIAMNQHQIGILNNRLQIGDLSESEMLDLHNQRNALSVSSAEAAGQLSSGRENYLPALSSNRPSGGSRFNSLQLGALALSNTPQRDYGALNGRQAKMQNDWIESFGLGDIAPYSRTSGLGGNGSGETNSLLRAILSALQSGKGGGNTSSWGRSSESAGAVAGTLDMKNTPRVDRGAN